MNIDPTDLSGCPLGHRCELCGTERGQMRPVTRRAAAGLICLTVCPACADGKGELNLHPSTIGRLVAQHAEHLHAARRQHVLRVRDRYAR